MMRTEVCRQFQINPRSMGVWSSGVSTALFNPQKYDREALRKASGLDHKFVVFYHGILSKPRGSIESIKSIALLKNSIRMLFYSCSGDKDSFPILNDAIIECGVQDNIVLHDKVPYEEVPKFIAMCDVGLVPIPNLSIWRNQCPLKLIEYASMGKVIVATDIPAHRQVLGNCQNVVFIPSGSSEEIAKAILEIYDDFGRFASNGECAKAIVNEKYSWQKIAANLEKYLLDL